MIALTVTKPDQGLDAPLDPRFGRAAALIFVDDADTSPAAITNPYREASHGAGTGLAWWVREHGATAVVSGEFGPKASSALDRMDIEMWRAPGGLTAREALEQMRRGELDRATPATAGGRGRHGR